MRLLAAALLVAAAASLAPAPTNAEPISSPKLQSHITRQKLQSNLWHLNKIARDHNGNRAFGLPGFEASRDFVLERVRRFGRIDSHVQSFTEWFTQTFEITLSIDGVSTSVVTFSGTPSTPNNSPVIAPLVATPVDDDDDATAGSGCTEAAYAGLNVTGRVVLIKRGACTFGSKSALAKQHGAAAVLIWNNVNATITGGTLGSGGDYAPTGMISLQDGTALYDRLQEAGSDETEVVEVVQAEFYVDAIGEYRETWNVIAETKGGDPNNVIVLGAHLDSVQAGAGINDDGSGTSALLELIEAVKHYDTNQKVRFIWWGAEEDGLLGSYHYTETLPAAEADKIALYLNFDMIGSLDGFYGVFDGDGSTYGFFPAEGSGAIEETFNDYFTDRGIVTTPAAWSNGSDYVGFVDLGVPVGGLFTGTVPQDNCYHQACDDIDNINWDIITTNTKSIAHVLAKYAVSLEGIPDYAQRVKRTKRSLSGRKRAPAVHAHHIGSVCGEKSELM